MINYSLSQYRGATRQIARSQDPVWNQPVYIIFWSVRCVAGQHWAYLIGAPREVGFNSIQLYHVFVGAIVRLE